jgi:hypothetical protein
VNESYPRARSCAASDPPGPPPVNSSRAGGETTGRPSAEELCSEVMSILDRAIPAVTAVRLLRDLFDIPEPDPQPLTRIPRAPYDPRD